MLKPFCLVLVFVIASGIAAKAQNDGSLSPDPSSGRKARRLLNEKYLTPTGETVPRPGLSQGAPTTKLDRDIEQENNRVDQSICSNCN